MDKNIIMNFIQMVAGKYPVLSAALHVLVIALTILLFIPRFNQKRAAFNGVLVVLFASVASIAIINGNPFNGGFFAVLFAIAIIELFRRRNEIKTVVFSKDTQGTNVKNALCIAFIFFGLVYPHFVDTNPALLIFLSPTGTIPCPTLIVILGLLNLFYPSVSKGVYTVTTLMAVFYGVTGVFLLQVYFDIPLMVIALYSLYNLKFLFKKHTDRMPAVQGVRAN